MKYKLLVATAALSWGFALGSVSQAQEWGVVTDDEWKAQPPPQYRDEGAVVLFDIGLAKTEFSGLDFTRHTRILILNEAGLDKVKNVEIEYYDYDKLHDLKAHILKPDGMSNELRDDEFLTETIGTTEKTYFSFSLAQPGDILEYSYRLEYYSGYEKLGPEKYFLFSQETRYESYKVHEEGIGRFIRDNDELKNVANLPSWFFDHDVFCFLSSYTAQLGGDLDYLYFTTNLRRSDREPEMERVKFLTATAYKKHTWEIENISPHKPDTSMLHEDEAQRVGLHFQLFSTSGANDVHVAAYSNEHWKYVGRSIQGYMNEYSRKTKAMMKQVRKLISDADTDIDKIDAVYGYVVSEFSVDSTGYVMRPAHNNMKSLYKDRTGMPFELNLLLVELLKIAGFEAWPVLISTRDKVTFRKSATFNHMLAMVNVDDGDILMDASSHNCPLGSLPRISASVEGVLVDYDNSRLIGFSTRVCD